MIWIVLVALVVALNVWAYRRTRNGAWHSTHGFEMRRRVRGSWERRPMTDDEVLERLEAEAW